VGGRLKGRRSKDEVKRPWPVFKLTVYALLAIAVLGLLYWYWFSREGLEKTREIMESDAKPKTSIPG
jgi:hypothetical protein